MALYIPHSIFHLARLLYVRPETFGPYYVPNIIVFWRNERIACCESVFDETLLWVYDATDEERVTLSTLGLLRKDRFGPPITGS